MTRYDLHVHTTNSDGRMTPEDVIRAASGRVAGLCITDHSDVTSSEALLAVAEQHDVRIPFPGIEISTKFHGKKYHVLAYGEGILQPSFRDYVRFPTELKNEIYESIAAQLRREGHHLPEFADMLRGDGLPSGHPGKWMMSKSLIGEYLILDGGDPDEIRADLIRRYEREKEKFTDRYLPTDTVIERVRDVAAFPVIAHPWWECPSGLNTRAGVRADLAEFRSHGLLGIEVSTRHGTVGTEADRREAAAELGLCAFAGSDFHANGKTQLGDFGLTVDEMHRITDVSATNGVRLAKSGWL